MADRTRLSRISEEMRREISSILREVKDPRVDGAMISVTAVDVAPDLSSAKVYYDPLPKVRARGKIGAGDLPAEDEREARELQQGLLAASGFVRRELSHRLNLRRTPALTFCRDPAPARAAQIERLLRDLK